QGRVYNGGTGVLEDYRGQKITRRMYDYALPILRAKGFHTALLEVIEGNEPAHQSYLKAGFAAKRVLAAFKGNLQIEKYNTAVVVAEAKANVYDFNAMVSTLPSWQNAAHSLNRVNDTLVTYTGYSEGELVAYLVYNPMLKRIHHIAVAPSFRRQGIGSALMYQVQLLHEDPISVINVDSSDQGAKVFLERSGLIPTINLLEMSMPI